jgi:DNA-binding transcriptional LysR family regulator
MYEGPEFRHLLSFVAVAEECSFGRAAERINLAQPSLSSQIKQVEDGLGANLFIRSQSGASLTAPGRQFLIFARQMLQMRDHAVRVTTSDKSGTDRPLRFGYSPFADHRLVEEVRTGYLDMVPGGHIRISSECSAELTTMVADGRLDAAIVTLPLSEKDLFVHPICREKVLVCLRRDDPLADARFIPQEVIASRLCVLFARIHQPSLFDQFERAFAKVGIALNPSEFISAPAEMQYLVKAGRGFSLAPESLKLDPELTLRPIAGLNLSVTTAFICLPSQVRPVLPMLAHRLEKHCSTAMNMEGRKRPNVRVTVENQHAFKKVS